MAQFGGKNPPWAREVGQPGVTMVSNLAGQQMLSQPGVATQAVYSLGAGPGQPQPHQFSVQQGGVPGLQGPLMHPQAAAAAALQQSVQLPQPGIAIPTTLATTQVATVSYPTPRAAAGQGPQPKQRVFTGTVTKLHDNFGFVDEDVFFQTSCVKGNIPKVGDRVLVEAAYNANMPFKWNATRIQVLPNQPLPGSNPPQTSTPNFTAQPRPMAPSGGGGGGMNQAQQMHPGPTPLMGQQLSQGRNNGRSGPRDGGGSGPSSGYRDRDRSSGGGGGGGGGGHDSRHSGLSNASSSGGGGGGGGGQHGNDRSRSHRDRESRRSPPSRSRRSRSPRRRSRSPSRAARSPPRSRRPPRVVPRYTVQIPKLSLDMKEANVISLKSRYTNMYIPSDFFNASFTWTDAFPAHRPLTLGQPCTFHVMHKEVDSIVKHEAILEPPDADHLYSAKVMLMSGPTLEELYHKSCALAEDPNETRETFQHPTRLLQFLVGLKGKSEPMAIGGPWSPSLDGADPSDDPRVLINTAIRTTRALTGIDLGVCTQWYRFAEIRYHRPEEVHKGRTLPARVETVVLFLPDVWSCNPSRLEWEQMSHNFKKQLSDKLLDESKDNGGAGSGETQEDDEEGEDGAEEKKDPSHFSELDPKTMKVNDLRRELEARSLSSKGLKSQLIARLTKALKTEQEKEEQEAAEQKEEEETKPSEPEEKPEVDDKEEERKKRDEEEKKRREERDRVARERRYNLPDNPSILVHPSTTAKGGKFDCTVMSLSVLLDYRPDDNKEHTFEVSLFAELFNEMLMRDCGFSIYKALVAAPEKPKEEKKSDKKSDRKDDKDKDKEKSKDKEEKKDDDKDKDKKEKKDDKEDEEPPAKKRKSSEEDKDKTEEKEEEKKKEKQKDKEKEKDKSKDDDDDDDEDDDDKSTTTSDGRKDKERSSSSKKSKESSSTSSSSDKKREKTKYMTMHPSLLLSFVYFDQSHAGYLLDKDVEEIMHTLGLFLSRAQVKKMVAKCLNRDSLNYRKLTDKPKPSEKKEEKKEEEVAATSEEKKMEEESEEAAAAEKAANDAMDEELLAMGNRPLLSTPRKELSPTTVSTPRTSKRNAAKKEEGGAAVPTGAESAASQGLVTYRGAILDINNVMQRLDKSEKTKRDTENKLKETQEDMDMLKSSFTSSEQNSQKVALELQELKKKLRDQRKATERSEHDSKKYHDMLVRSKGPLSSILQDIKDTISSGGDSSSSSSSSSVTVKTEPKTEVNGE